MNRAKRSYFAGKTTKLDANAPILYARYASSTGDGNGRKLEESAATPKSKPPVGTHGVVVPTVDPRGPGSQGRGEDFQMNISNAGGEVDVQPMKRLRKKERWSEERKAAAKVERDIQDAREEANGKNPGESKSRRKKEKKKKREEEVKVRKLSTEEKISGPGNASEAETLRDTLGFKTGEMQEKSIPGFEFGFNASNQHNGVQEPVNGVPHGTEDEPELDGTSSSSTDSKTNKGSEYGQQVRQNYRNMGESSENPRVEETVDGFVPRRIFVGGMPFGYTEDMIREYWEYCGAIEDLDMMTFPDTGRFKGIAFITFASEEAFESALACDGTDCDGQIIKVQRCKADNKKRFAKQQTPQPIKLPLDLNSTQDITENQQADMQNFQPRMRQSAQKVQGYNVAYVGNIAFAASSDDIKALFEPFGATLVRLHTDKETGKPKGYAHVHFNDEESLDRAIEMDGTPLLGRRIKVGFAQKKKNNL